MSEIIEHEDAGNGRAVRVGQSHTQVPLKVYQDIYHQVTGRTEQIRKRYSENILVEFSDLEQLHHKVSQLCDVHHVVARNESVSVFHEKERKEVFTSFERFRLYNGNATSPSVNVVFKYNFSIIPAGLERPQEYVVTARLTSRVAAIKQMEEEAPPFMRGRFIGYMAGSAAEVTVDYADYVVARGFLEAFDEWIAGCKSTPKSQLLQLLRQHSHRIPEVARLAVSAIIVGFALQAIPTVLGQSASPQAIARFIVILVGGSYIVLSLTRFFAEFIEVAIDTYPVLSYLKLNKGDEKLIAEASSAKPRAWLQLTLGAVGSIILGIISAKLEKLM
ncbi:MAG: hypothetical protein HEQ17_14035 [Limnohabitans sp.]|uniref:hypothetical protein n=1 Tax=Limnohabitans sp. TaxID=1907725 RepID=UPI0025E74777|nr:hypothetical protein [Limnohabitans sp.]MCO4089985.1 hypothetical protein [Limnohabitans sp.]